MELTGSYSTQTMIMYVLAAVLPAAFLMRYIYQMDAREREPRGILVKMIFAGILAAIGAMILETLFDAMMERYLSFLEFASYTACEALMIGAAEEGCKFFFMKKFSWKRPEFNYRFDGMVYAVFTSLGFAALENVLYVFSYGSSVIVTRALLTIPAHMSFAVYMGMFYGRAKICDVRGRQSLCKMNLVFAFLSAVFMHAFYDGTLMIGTDLSFLLFVGFVVVMYIVIFRTVRSESRSDESIY